MSRDRTSTASNLPICAAGASCPQAIDQFRGWIRIGWQAQFDLSFFYCIARAGANFPVDLADSLVALFDQKALQVHDLLSCQRRDLRQTRMIDGWSACKPGREISDSGRINHRRIPAEECFEVRIDKKSRAVSAHRQDQGSRQVTCGSFTVRWLYAPADPLRLRMLNTNAGRLPWHGGWDTHFLQPRLVTLPAETDQEVGRRGKRIGNTFNEVATAVPVKIDSVL